MDNSHFFPLSPEEAKANLREASTHLDPGAWLMRHKWQLLGLAFATGFVAARLPASSGAAFVRQAAPLLLSALQQRHEE